MVEIKFGCQIPNRVLVVQYMLASKKEFYSCPNGQIYSEYTVFSIVLYIAPTFISSVQSIREDGGSLSVCIMGGITNETVAIQTQNTSSAASKLINWSRQQSGLT